ncbi:MAG: hypothetical protein WEB87_06365, partial [Bacteriovoracaceae bacterium]
MARKILITLFTLSLLPSALGAEFKHLKLKNELFELDQLEKNQATKMERHSRGARAQSAMSKAAADNLRERVARKLLNLKPQKALGGVVEDSSPLMQKIIEVLAGNYRQIGEEQTAPLALNHDMGGGVLNFSGFSWHKPLANFQLYVNRQLAPDLFSDRWIVHDTFVVGVDASTLLTNLKEEDLIDISDEGIGAFAGVSFLRKYHYYHFAGTFLEGLQADYSKLFLSFTKFNPHNVLRLPQYELIKKHDQFTFNAGGFANFPPTGGFSGRAGVLVSVAYENTVSMQALGPNDNPEEGEFLRMSVDKKVETSADAHLSLQLDFFKILKLTLLSFDLEYSYGKTNATHLSFFEKDRGVIKESPQHKEEFKNLVKGKTDQVLEFRNNIVQLDERINQNLNSKYSFLLMGSVKKRQTEQIKVIKDGVEKVFYKHYAESIKFIQNLWSRIFGVVVYKIFDWDIGVKNAAESKKKLSVEFEDMQELGEAKVDQPDKFSVTLTQTFQAAKTHRWWHKLYRKESQRHLSDMTNLDAKYVEMVKERSLRGPLEISSKIQILAPGLHHFNFLDENRAFKVFQNICKAKRGCQNLL